ncbi:MAG TPA: FIST N-terminal domain-containing protein [Pirellulales bacterium]|jgi:small ligand-binding sensory domain FIST
MTTDVASRSRFSTGFSQQEDARQAALEASRQALDKLGARPHLALVFAAGFEPDDFAILARTLHAELGAGCLLGCSAESLVYDATEIEGDRGLVVWLTHLPGVTLTPMHLEFERTDDGVAMLGWPESLEGTLPAGSSLLLLADPFTFPADTLLAHLNRHQEGIPVFGGMASGAMSAGDNRLIFADQALDDGAVAVLIDGPIRVRNVVSQGCRPIGRHFVVTKADDNVILELGGRPAVAQLQELYQQLTPAEQQLAQRGLHVGQVINEYQDRFSRGDFLVRNVQGIDAKAGAIAIGDYVRVGQTVQFHVRDAATADEDLAELLATAHSTNRGSCAGALVFTCNGRGTRLFPEPHHDAQAVARQWPAVPTAGFFAQGEIGPVGGKNFIHGFTASIALFEPTAEKSA